MPLIAPKLRPNAHLRVIAPSRSLAIFGDDVPARADRRLAELGMTVSFGRGVRQRDAFDSSPVVSRLADLHAAFDDDSVDGVLTAIGGYNSHEILPGIDWGLLRAKPKPLCGFSDITALQNAILARADLVTYSGPHYTTFAVQRGLEETVAWFRRCLFDDAAYDVTASATWTDEPWPDEVVPGDRMEPGDGWWVLQAGAATGTVIGGNAGTFGLLNGTEYQPDRSGTILLLEDDAESAPHDFARALVALTQQPGFDGVRGLLIGRFRKESRMTRELLAELVGSRSRLSGRPVIANVDFGHTYPMVTLPIGGSITMIADRAGPSRITVTRH